MEAGQVYDIELFQGIAHSEVDEILVCSNSMFRKYQKGGIVFRQEDRAERLFIVLRGRVNLVKYTVSGEKKLIAALKENDVFGEQCFFTTACQQWFDAEAGTDAETLEIPWRYFHCFCDRLCSHHRQILNNLLGILARKGFTAMHRIYINHSPALKDRIAIWLLDEADEKGNVVLHMKREELADFFGVARPSLSRTLMRMQEEGLIEVGKTRIHMTERSLVEQILLE